MADANSTYIHTLDDVIGLVGEASKGFTELEAILRAIISGGSDTLDKAALARAGVRISQDLANFYDCLREQLKDNGISFAEADHAH